MYAGLPKRPIAPLTVMFSPIICPVTFNEPVTCRSPVVPLSKIVARTLLSLSLMFKDVAAVEITPLCTSRLFCATTLPVTTRSPVVPLSNIVTKSFEPSRSIIVPVFATLMPSVVEDVLMFSPDIRTFSTLRSPRRFNSFSTSMLSTMSSSRLITSTSFAFVTALSAKSAVTIVPSAIFALVTALSAIVLVPTASAAILAAVTAPSAIFAVVTAPSAIFAVTTAALAI